MSRLQGMKVIVYHSSFRDLFNFASIEQVADLEPKPAYVYPPVLSYPVARQLMRY